MSERTLRNRDRYNRMARGYEALVRFGSFGQLERFYRAVAAELDARPGGTLLDLGCGPGTLVPHLLAKAGRIIGVDVSDAMIERARARARREGWRNVELERCDAREFAPPGPLDAVVFCLSLTTTPDPDDLLSRALSWLKPGAQLAVLDSLPERSRPLARAAIHAKAPLVGAAPAERLLPALLERLDGARVRRFHFGVYTLVSGRTRA
jgi:demethylmenaquinone methyltransferase/2-methoxy-6-polyprenyl-1,4-benzoquinol methylase